MHNLHIQIKYDLIHIDIPILNHCIWERVQVHVRKTTQDLEKWPTMRWKQNKNNEIIIAIDDFEWNIAHFTNEKRKKEEKQNILSHTHTRTKKTLNVPMPMWLLIDMSPLPITIKGDMRIMLHTNKHIFDMMLKFLFALYSIFPISLPFMFEWICCSLNIFVLLFGCRFPYISHPIRQSTKKKKNE